MKIVPDEWKGKEGLKHLRHLAIGGLFFVTGGTYLAVTVGPDFVAAVISIAAVFLLFDKNSLKHLRQELKYLKSSKGE